MCNSCLTKSLPVSVIIITIIIIIIIIIIVFSVSATIVAVVYGQQQRCVEQLFDNVINCFTEQGLDLNVEPGQQDATKLMQETQAMDPSVQCR